ncbi:zona pellucida sperm-binding protein 3-like, partial [Salmo trutta]|uniref:zona pellucida sperm-binding protein 3-like n=1 Tax=Salmo trutta TaxID=8032 RepID=UPI001130613B
RAEGGSNERQSFIKPFVKVLLAEDSPSYHELPVFQNSRVPLVDMEHFSPVHGTGHKQLPDKGRKTLTLCTNTEAIWSKKSKIPSIKSLVNNRVAYSNTLQYDPPNLQGYIRRAAPFTLRVVCHFNRYHYSYKIGYMLNIVHKVSKPMKNRTHSMLTARNAQWERLAQSDVYSMGKPMYFQAEAPSMSKDGRLYALSCNVTIKHSHSSTPHFTVIDNFGFIPYKRNVVRFTMDAFPFQGMTAGQPQQLYTHCAMSVGRSVPSSTAKACTYDSAAGGWKELYGASSVCSCSTTKMVTSKPWSVEYNTKPALTQEVTTTSQPETVVEGQLGVRQVERLKGRPVKGFAVVEVEQVSEPHRTFAEFFGVDK